MVYQGTWGELTHACKKNMQTTQKGPCRDSDQESSCCEATVLENQLELIHYVKKVLNSNMFTCVLKVRI